MDIVYFVILHLVNAAQSLVCLLQSSLQSQINAKLTHTLASTRTLYMLSPTVIDEWI